LPWGDERQVEQSKQADKFCAHQSAKEFLPEECLCEPAFLLNGGQPDEPSLPVALVPTRAMVKERIKVRRFSADVLNSVGSGRCPPYNRNNPKL
jgi:hypothetical protein